MSFDKQKLIFFFFFNFETLFRGPLRKCSLLPRGDYALLKVQNVSLTWGDHFISNIHLIKVKNIKWSLCPETLTSEITQVRLTPLDHAEDLPPLRASLLA